jgi:7-cyano-7-deazaguanine synthase in queuosine biosynthesis
MAVGIDSVGYEAYFKELYDDLGIEMSEVTLAYYQEHDRRIESARAHAKKQKQRKSEQRTN